MHVFLIITLFSLTAGAVQKDKVCSNENMLSLLNQSGKIIGQLGRYKVSVARILDSTKTQNVDLVRAQLGSLASVTSNAMEKPLTELDQLIKTHPECNIGGAFGILN